MADAGPQSSSWAGFAWSDWHDFGRARDDRLIPATPGLYRFRVQGEAGLFYIGESKARWTRLDDLARARRRHSADYYLQGRGDPGHSSAPYFIVCEEAGCRIEVSWTLGELSDKNKRRAAEARLILLHREATGEDPPVQDGGKGVSDYLKRRGSRSAPS